MNQPTGTPDRLNFNLEFGPASEVSLTVVDLQRDTWLGRQVARLACELLQPEPLVVVTVGEGTREPPDTWQTLSEWPTSATVGELRELADLREQLKRAKGDIEAAQARLIEALGEVDDASHFDSIVDQAVETVELLTSAWRANTHLVDGLKGALGIDDPVIDRGRVLNKACNAIRDREAVLKLNGELQSALKEAERLRDEADDASKEWAALYRREVEAREAEVRGLEAEISRLRAHLSPLRGAFDAAATPDVAPATPDVAPAASEPVSNPDTLPEPPAAADDDTTDPTSSEPTKGEIEDEVAALIDAWFEDDGNQGPCVLTTLLVLEALEVEPTVYLRARVGHAISAVVSRRKLLLTKRVPGVAERDASGDGGQRYEIRRGRSDDRAAAKARRTPGLR